MLSLHCVSINQYIYGSGSTLSSLYLGRVSANEAVEVLVPLHESGQTSAAGLLELGILCRGALEGGVDEAEEVVRVEGGEGGEGQEEDVPQGTQCQYLEERERGVGREKEIGASRSSGECENIWKSSTSCIGN